MSFTVLFIVCTIINVIISTSKSLITINGKKLNAALVNAVSAGFYAYIVVLTASGDISTLWKMAITAICNFLGVYIVKWIQEKRTPVKLWKLEATLKPQYFANTIAELENNGIPHNYVDIQKYILINCYCATKHETKTAKTILQKYGARYFVGKSEENA